MQLTQSMKDLLKSPFLTLLSILLFINPLVMSNATKELFEFPKMFFVYYVGTLIFAIFLTNIVLKKQRIVWPSRIIFLYLLINLISTILSSHQYTSFWGYYSRFNEGMLSSLVYLGIYIVCINKLKISDFPGLMKVACLTLFPISLIGIMQHFGFGTGVVERVYSTFGQPNWLAQYLVMLLPLVLYLSITGFTMFWALLFITGFSCLWFTYSVSGIVGFIAVSLVSTTIFYNKKLLNKKSLLRILTIYLVCLTVALSNLGLFKDKVT
ncbi:hypothetical protein HGB13_05180, partial [bacterium]|nr:hypothetical protein [bacterium]